MSEVTEAIVTGMNSDGGMINIANACFNEKARSVRGSS